MIKKRKIPMRTCIGCRQQKPKKELVRIVRNTEQKIVLDMTGKIPGRGAYICLSEDCLQNAIKGKRLEKNLQQSITSDLITELSKLLRNA
jgi:uncharacterized protein